MIDISYSIRKQMKVEMELCATHIFYASSNPQNLTFKKKITQ